MNISGKMRPVETIPGMGGERIQEMDGYSQLSCTTMLTELCLPASYKIQILRKYHDHRPLILQHMFLVCIFLSVFDLFNICPAFHPFYYK
jgi:hypothetical protein